MLETIIVLSMLIIDQLSKIWISTSLPESLPLIKDALHFTYVKNYGAAFGMLQNQRTFFLIVTAAALAAIVYVAIRFRKNGSLLLRIGIALFLAGAAGNFIDRLILGYVRDFIDFRLINFAVFNIADSCISIGAVLIGWDVLVLDYIKKRKQPALPAKEDSVTDNAAVLEESAPPDLADIPNNNV